MATGDNRGRMRSDLVMFLTILKEHRGGSISVRDLAERMEISRAGAYRWIEAMSGCMDFELKQGVVYIPKQDDLFLQVK